MTTLRIHPPRPGPPQTTLLLQPGLAARQRRALVSVVAAAHVLALWALLQGDRVRQVVREMAPLMVTLIVPRGVEQAPLPAAPPPRPQPLPAPPPQAAPVPATPTVAALATAVPAAATAPTALAVADRPPALTAPVAVQPAPPPQAPAPAPRKEVVASAVRYLAEPPVEVPRASRRAGEFGVVWLRVVVGVQGTPLHVSLLRSSGFTRLDEQALWAMRQARFTPYVEDGRAIEVEVTAPIEYPRD